MHGVQKVTMLTAYSHRLNFGQQDLSWLTGNE